jgi:hypothetical protein
LTPNVLNEVKHRKVDLEQIKRDKEALEVKMGEDTSEEDTKTLVAFVGVISRHTREIKKFEDWLTEKSTLPLKFEKVSNVNSVKLMAGVMASVPLSFFSYGSKGMISIGFLSLPSVGVGEEAVRLVEPVVEEAPRDYISKRSLSLINTLKMEVS